jgi:MinD-like ATPase involved in chromosome partitioning or flagellar assembly
MNSEFLDKYATAHRHAAAEPTAAREPGEPVKKNNTGPAEQVEPDLGSLPVMNWPLGPLEPDAPSEPARSANSAPRGIPSPGPAVPAPADRMPTAKEQIAAGTYRPGRRAAAHYASDNETTMAIASAAGREVSARPDAQPAEGTAVSGQPYASAQQGFSGATVDQPPRWQPAAGASATLNYQFRTDDLVKTRREPAELGWRKTVYVGSFHAINLGPSAFEKRLREQKAMIASNIPGNYQIPVLSIKGGVGKTRTIAGMGTVFGQYRTEPVLAIDANPGYGSLGRLIDPAATDSMREWLDDAALRTYPKARSHTGKNKQGLEVLAGNQNVANPVWLDADMFSATLKRAQQFYQLSLIDCGPMIDHPVTPGILANASALVIVSSMQAEHVDKAGQTIEWLAARSAHELLKRTVVVLNDAFRSQTRGFVDHVTERVAPHVQAVKVIPFDKHLRDAVTLDFEALRPRTQLAYIELAAELATGFSSGYLPGAPSSVSPAPSSAPVGAGRR